MPLIMTFYCTFTKYTKTENRFCILNHILLSRSLDIRSSIYLKIKTMYIPLHLQSRRHN